MDIYVVSNVWWRDGATVIGAGASKQDAESIADRRDGAEPVAGWAPWKPDADGQPVTRRDALMFDGTTHASLYQEIVCVPLAGYLGDWPIIQPIDETVDGLRYNVRALTMRSEIEEIGRTFGAP